MFSFAFHRKTGAPILIKVVRSSLPANESQLFYLLLDQANELQCMIQNQPDLIKSSEVRQQMQVLKA